MNKICICGHFGGDKEFFDGQTVKTKNIYNFLVQRYGDEFVSRLDTYNWKKNPFAFFFKCIHMFQNNDVIIMLPAHNGVKVFLPLFTALNKSYKRKILYVVVGAWLPEMLNKRKKLIKYVKEFDKVLVETTKMKSDLELLKVNNVDILLNFKDLHEISRDNLKLDFKKPYKLCTFSRVMKEKGIEDAINAVKDINELYGEEVFQLDIYGSIDSEYEIEFKKLRNEFPDYIKYMECVSSDMAIEVLKEYYMLLFPTRFRTEGIPGTVIDALSSGVPVIASKWDNYSDILENGFNSYLYDMNNINAFKEILKNVANEKNIALMKENSLVSSYKFRKENACAILLKILSEYENDSSVNCDVNRLLCIVSSMDRGGAETFLMKVYRAIDKTKYQMDFCVSKERCL